jgi:hypothetical protein
VSKFIYDDLEALQRVYVRSIRAYSKIGGGVFEYTPDLSVSDYVSFLAPLNFDGKRLVQFRHKGKEDEGSTTDEMWNAYHAVRGLIVQARDVK